MNIWWGIPKKRYLQHRKYFEEDIEFQIDISNQEYKINSNIIQNLTENYNIDNFFYFDELKPYYPLGYFV